MSNISSVLKFNDYIVDKVEFCNNIEFDSENVELKIDIDDTIEFKDDKNTFFLHLKTKIFPDAVKNNYPFSMNIAITGIFHFNEDENISEIDKQKFARINSIAILFPYVRALVSTYTASANIQPLILPPINVVKYVKDKINQRDI